MQKKIIINCDNKQTRVAVLEDNKLVEIYLERPVYQRVVGNIYKGVVANVLPGMQAAFVEIGLERNAFLYVDDAQLNNEETDKGKGKKTIEQLLRPGEEIMVQVIKEPFGSKGARLTRQIALPGRHLVLMPWADYTGVSRRIEDAAERERLRQLASQLRPEDMGLIVRTVAEGEDASAFQQDLTFLLSLWERTQKRYLQKSAPALIYQDLDLIYRILRDLFTDQIDQLLIDTRYEYEKILETLDVIGPQLRERVQLYQGEAPIFDVYGIEAEIEKALSRTVWLSCGGYLVFDHTEALTVIDVNTGKYIGKTNLADTVLKTNLQAAEEIVRQIRLRDIGGIIIIDFIDMDREEDSQQVLALLSEKIKQDRTKSHVVGMTGLGLVEMTRKKARQGLDAVLQQSCPYCSGRGKVLAADVISARTERQLRSFLAGLDAEAILVELHQSVAGLLIGPNGSYLRKLEEDTGKIIYIRGSDTIHVEKYKILAVGSQAEVRVQAFPVAVGEIHQVKVEEPHTNNPYDGIARLNGFIIDVQAGGAYVGEEISVEILEVTKTFARAKVVTN